jgi:hypothetical protein
MEINTKGPGVDMSRVEHVYVGVAIPVSEDGTPIRPKPEPKKTRGSESRCPKCGGTLLRQPGCEVITNPRKQRIYTYECMSCEYIGKYAEDI